MIINNVYNEAHYLYKNDIEDIITQIEDLRKELDKKLGMENNNLGDVLELSRDLDELIVKYLKWIYEK